MEPLIEEWKAIPGWEGFYEASTFGQIRSIDRTIRTVDGRTCHLRGKVLDCKANITRFTELTGGRAKTYRVEYLTLLTFKGPPPAGHRAAHIDHKNRVDKTINNLQWETQSSYSKRTGCGLPNFGQVVNEARARRKLALY